MIVAIALTPGVSDASCGDWLQFSSMSHGESATPTTLGGAGWKDTGRERASLPRSSDAALGGERQRPCTAPECRQAPTVPSPLPVSADVRTENELFGCCLSSSATSLAPGSDRFDTVSGSELEGVRRQIERPPRG